MDGLVYAGGMSEPMPPAPPRAPKKTSSVRHTRAIQRDRSKRPPVSPPDAEIEARLTELIHPLTLRQVAHYHDLGLRERVLSLPVVVALVLSMIWRQVGAVTTLAHLLQREGLLWTAPVRVSQQALSARLHSFPADLFRRVLDDLLPPMQGRWAYAVALYYQRWRIEDGYAVVKRLLGLAYFWVGSANGVQLQLWATWLLYAVLVDLTDAVAEELNQPFAALSLEMVYRSLYFFTAAYQRGEATDVVPYLAAEARDLGILKRHRKRDPTPSRFDQLRLTFASTA
jgi:hypothetical protein